MRGGVLLAKRLLNLHIILEGHFNKYALHCYTSREGPGGIEEDEATSLGDYYVELGLVLKTCAFVLYLRDISSVYYNIIWRRKSYLRIRSDYVFSLSYFANH